MARIRIASRLRALLLVPVAVLLTGCEEIGYGVREHPEIVKALAKREVTLVERRF